MTANFAQSGFLTEVAALLTAIAALIGAIFAAWKYLDERGKRKDAEHREQEAEARNEELESENTRLSGGKADSWGNRIGTQAVRINELLSVSEFRTIDQVYEVLVREFPTTTRGSVSSHINWFKKRHPKNLLTRGEGKGAAYRLVER